MDIHDNCLLRFHATMEVGPSCHGMLKSCHRKYFDKEGWTIEIGNILKLNNSSPQIYKKISLKKVLSHSFCNSFHLCVGRIVFLVLGFWGE